MKQERIRTKTHVALLRGVNNAGAKRVSMADLRALFEALGFADVRTLLNSGNVIFSVPASQRGDIAARIEKALASKLMLVSVVIILSPDEVAAAVRGNPLRKMAINPSWLLVVVPQVASKLAQLKPLLKGRWAPEALALGRRVAYLWCAKGVAKSPLWMAVERALEKSATARNISTMSRIMAIMEDKS